MTEREPLSVSELNARIKGLIESDPVLGSVYVRVIVAVRRKTNKPRVRPNINQFSPLQQLSRIHHKLLPARIPLLFHFRLAVQNRLFLLRNPGQVCYNFLFHDYSSHFSRFFCFLLYSIPVQISNVLFLLTF